MSDTGQFTREEFEAALNSQVEERLAAEREKLLKDQEKVAAKIAKDDPRFGEMQEELKSLRAEQKKVVKEREDREKALAEAERKAQEEKLSAQELIEKRSAEMQAQYESLRKQREEDKAIFEREREIDRITLYTQRAIDANRENIEPRLLDYIGGHTEEEVNASIQVAINKTQEMFAEINEAQTLNRAAMPGVRPGPPAITELDQPASDGSVSAEDIKAMSWDNYAKFRQGRVPQSGQGIFG
jgi:hypothetical protein